MRPSLPVLAAASSLTGALAGAVLALLLGVVELGGEPGTTRQPAPVAAPRPPGADPPTGAGGIAVPPEELGERRATVEALGVMRRWDARRARAWARGEPSLLRPLYTPGSVAGRRDAVLLERYAERGWSVRGLRPQVLAAEALTLTGDRVRLRVVERHPGLSVGGADAPGPAAVDRSDRPSDDQVRVVTLVKSRTGWRVARVEAA